MPLFSAAVTGDTPILKISTETENPALPEDWLNTDNVEEPPSGQVGELLNRSLSEPDLQKLDENGELKEAAQPGQNLEIHFKQNLS